MSYGYLAPHWIVMGAGNDTVTGDPTGDDLFQLGGNNSPFGSFTGSVGGVNNGWDSFSGGGGYDKIVVSKQSGYYWTALMLADDGLHGIEQIGFSGATGPKPVYFADTIDFSDVVNISAGVRIYGRSNDNVFTGGSVGEHVEGAAGDDILYGNGGNDTLYGDSDLTGIYNPWNDSWATGDDQLYGGDGDDLLDGGAGSNDLWGGAGDDIFQVTSAADQSTIHDFALSEKIRIETSVASNYLALGIADDLNGDAHVTVGGVDLTLLGISTASLNSSHFEFFTI